MSPYSAEKLIASGVLFLYRWRDKGGVPQSPEERADLDQQHHHLRAEESTADAKKFEEERRALGAEKLPEKELFHQQLQKKKQQE
eukprot:scaffold306817_cov67-Attheya_sp.AAC.8